MERCRARWVRIVFVAPKGRESAGGVSDRRDGATLGAIEYVRRGGPSWGRAAAGRFALLWRSARRIDLTISLAMDQRQAVASLFDQVADTYDALDVEFFQPIASRLVGALDPQKGERTVDIGCGRGAVLFPLAAAVGPTGSVVGLDLSPRMVQATAADAARAGLDVVEVRVGDAMAPDLPLSSYDVVASSLVLFFLPDPLAALRAWRNLLVESGRLGVSTFGSYDDRWANTVDALRAHAPADVAGARTISRQGPFESDEGMEHLLTESGYRHVRTLSSVVTPRFRDCEHWYDWSMSVGQRRFWQSVPPERLEEVKTAAFAAVGECRDEHGRIGFDQRVRFTLGIR